LLDYPLCQKLQARGAQNLESGMKSVLKVVMLTAPEKTKIIESFRLGAVGIVLKGTARPIWLSSIAAVVAGEFWLGSESLAVLIQAIRESASHGGGAVSARHFGLTPREIEIVQKIADGRSNKEVGQDFSIREQTVKHHLTNIFGKVGVSSRLELALFARDHQILSMPGFAESAPAAEHQDNWLRAEKEQPETSRPEMVREMKKRSKDA
jgi:DNA-binding NarL/FixJ family response regulator